MDDFLIKAEGLKVYYDNREVLDCPDLTIHRHDFIGVIGPNGAGKTTLVKALLKSIPYQGKVIYSKSIEDNGVRRIGYLPQVHSVDRSFPIAVTEVVLSGLLAGKGLFGRYTQKDRRKAGEVLDAVGIEHLSGKPVGALSGGEFQRVMLCRALISDPHLLVLDEPNTFVDNQFENELYRLLAGINERIAILMVSHDLGTITQHIKSIVCVNHTVHHHHSNLITPEQLQHYNCPIQLVYHGDIPHTVLCNHD